MPLEVAHGVLALAVVLVPGFEGDVGAGGASALTPRSRSTTPSTSRRHTSAAGTTRLANSSMVTPRRANAPAAVRSTCTPWPTPSCSVRAGSSYMPTTNDVTVVGPEAEALLTRMAGPKLRITETPPVGVSQRRTGSSTTSCQLA